MIISIGIVGGVLLIVGIISYVLMNQSLPKPNEKIVTSLPAKKMPSETTKDYRDPSGFTFNYPDDLTLEKRETNDSASYASLILENKEIKGDISIDVVDTKLKTIQEWLTKNNYASGSAIVTPKQLGTLSAIEVKTKDKIILAAIDNGVLFMISVLFDGEEDFWKEAYRVVAADFSFVQSQTETSGGSSQAAPQGEDDIIVEEEIVE